MARAHPATVVADGPIRHWRHRHHEARDEAEKRGELRILAEALLEVEGEGEGLWFAGAKWRPTANMVAMERAGGHEGE